MIAQTSATEGALPNSRWCRDDAVSLLLIGGTAYMTAAIAHETIGHGMATVLMGGKVSLFTSVHILGTASGRIIDLAGPLNNLIGGGLFALLLSVQRRKEASGTRLFLWMAMACNLLWGTGYMAYGAVLNCGDWLALIRGMEPQGGWRLLLGGMGGLGYGLTIWKLARILPFLAGPDGLASSFIRTLRVIGLAYVGAGLTACSAGLLDPDGPLWAISENSAPASFLAEAGLLLIPFLKQKALHPPREPRRTPSRIFLTRSYLVVSAIAISLFVGVLGRGFRCDPGPATKESGAAFRSVLEASGEKRG